MATRNNVFILSLKQQVIFPSIRVNITIPKQVFEELCEFCEKNDSTNVGVIVAKSVARGVEDLHDVGTYCRIASHSQSTTKVGNQEVSVVTLLIEGQNRFRVRSYSQTSPFRLATVQMLEEREGVDKEKEVKSLAEKVKENVVELLKDAVPSGKQSGRQGGSLRNLFGNGRQRIRWPASSSILADMIAAGLEQLSIAERQQVLETVDVRQRLELVLNLLGKVVEVQKLSAEISSKTSKRTEDELRETVLKRQLQELQKEMQKLKAKRAEDDTDAEGDEDAEEAEDEEDDVSALREQLRNADLSPEARKASQRELRRLQNIQPNHPEYTVCRTYLETLASLPWSVSSADDLDLQAARAILDSDHHGLEKVKLRIMEFLAVQKMRGDMKGPILCLHGPPGVGKTSLGRSVAKSLGRKFHRIALGGVRDEAELRGHRRTYIGSMPGAILQGLNQMKVNNPVILLDEIDKLTKNAMFNPSGALLELLDPEQNHTFKDHYLGVPFDLSKVLFLCTCNELHTIDRPLLDRMEIIELSGYTVEEKVHIATTHLLPKQRKMHALEYDADSKDAEVGEGLVDEGKPVATKDVPLISLTPAAIADLVSKWTMESGVRGLERRMAQICRWAALRLAGPADDEEIFKEDKGEAGRLAEESLAECWVGAKGGPLMVDAKHLPYIVGAEVFEPDLAERLTVGVAMGLGVTMTGGHLLFVEANRSRGSSQLTVTGQLGDVMRESVSAAISLLRSKYYYAILASGSDAVSIAPPLAAGPQSVEATAKFQTVLAQLVAKGDGAKDPFGGDDVHVHFPAGGTPKDGPSAGVATALALASLLLDRPVRSDTAVTGEITLRGHVLPVGGIRDKVLAAHRAGLKHVLVPFGNQRHVKDEIPLSAMGEVEVHYLKHIDEALAWAFADGAVGAGTSARPAAPAFASKL